MKQYYSHKKIDIHEYLPPELYFYLKAKGWLWKAWANLDPALIITDGILRDRFGSLYINTYMFEMDPAKVRTASGVRIDYNPEFMKYLPKWLLWYADKRKIEHEKELASGIKSVGAFFSLHRSWKGSDKIFLKYSADEVREDIFTNPDNYPGLTCLEIDISWVHTDTRNHRKDLYGIKKVKPY